MGQIKYSKIIHTPSLNNQYYPLKIILKMTTSTSLITTKALNNPYIQFLSFALIESFTLVRSLSPK